MKHALFLLLLIAAPVFATEKPNILLLLVDDLKPAIGAFGDKFAVTPHLDKLTGRGMRFEAAYCNQAVCAPSRFNLMLGSRSTSSGLYNLGSKLRKSYPKAITMPQYFAKHAYRTESLGKVFHICPGNGAERGKPVHGAYRLVAYFSLGQHGGVGENGRNANSSFDVLMPFGVMRSMGVAIASTSRTFSRL